MRRNKITLSVISCFLLLLFYAIACRPSYTPNDPVELQENFPSAAFAKTPKDIPPIPKWNRPTEPRLHIPTPLFIGFTSNFLLLQQCVVSYLTAGWPASDIYVVDNTGTQLSNLRNNLTFQNPSFLDYSRLRHIFEVKVISTPTRLSFSQLQNFYLHEALRRGWKYYFWSHMDIVALSDQVVDGKYESLYQRAVNDLLGGLSEDWVFRFYSYDRLALVRVAALDKLGGWDTLISYYPADCDMNRRAQEAGYKNPSPYIGHFYDVGDTLEELEVMYHAEPGSGNHRKLMEFFANLMAKKNGQKDRNTWQWVQQGGQKEQYYNDIQRSKWVQNQWNQLGRAVFRYKWGSSNCWPESGRSWW